MRIIRFLLSTALVVALIGVLGGTAQAQMTNFEGGVYFNGGFPQGEFKDQIDKNAFGLSGQFFYAPKKSPLAIGLELGWMNYGNETRREPFSTTIPDVTVEVNTSNNIVQGFFILRGHMSQGPIRAYADGLVGFNYLFTETKISDEDGGEDIASTTNQDDGAFAYGAVHEILWQAPGSQCRRGFCRAAQRWHPDRVPLYSTPVGKGKPFEVLLDAGLRYVLGGDAEYLKKGSIAREEGSVTYDTLNSKTNMLRLHFGVAVRF